MDNISNLFMFYKIDTVEVTKFSVANFAMLHSFGESRALDESGEWKESWKRKVDRIVLHAFLFQSHNARKKTQI